MPGIGGPGTVPMAPTPACRCACQAWWEHTGDWSPVGMQRTVKARYVCPISFLWIIHMTLLGDCSRNQQPANADCKATACLVLQM